MSNNVEPNISVNKKNQSLKLNIQIPRGLISISGLNLGLIIFKIIFRCRRHSNSAKQVYGPQIFYKNQ